MRTLPLLAILMMTCSLSACGLPGTPGADNTLSDIDEDRVLADLVDDPNEPDYLVNEPINVNARLEIEPGVVIAFARDAQLTIRGREGGVLIARGTQTQPITLRGQDAAPGSWHGVYIDNSTSSENALEHVTISHGGGKAFGSGLEASNLGVGGFVGASTLSITNSTFRDSAALGIELETESRLSAFADNTFASNAAYDVRIPAEEARQLDAGSTFDTSPGVELFQSSIDTAGTWTKLQTGIAVTGDLDVQTRLVLEPGVDLSFGDNISLTVRGRADGVLLAKGTAEDPILMGRLGGVTWRGVYIDNSTSSENALEHVAFSHGGFEAFKDDQRALLTIGGFVGESAIQVRDCSFQNSADAGIYIESDNVVNDDIATANSFAENAGADVIQQ